MLLPLIGFALWLLLLIGLTFLFWLRPASFFSQGEAITPSHMVIAATLAVLLFLSCFFVGVWMSMAEMKGILWKF